MLAPGFSITAGGWQNLPPISRALATYFSLEITPEYSCVMCCHWIKRLKSNDVCVMFKQSKKQAEPSNPWHLKFYSYPARKSSVFFTSEIKKKKRLYKGTQLLVNDWEVFIVGPKVKKPNWLVVCQLPNLQRWLRSWTRVYREQIQLVVRAGIEHRASRL